MRRDRHIDKTENIVVNWLENAIYKSNVALCKFSRLVKMNECLTTDNNDHIIID